MCMRRAQLKWNVIRNVYLCKNVQETYDDEDEYVK